MKILTFDLEEWYYEKMFRGNRKNKYAEFDWVLNQILDQLDKVNTNATFFCVGELAKHFPEVVNRIADRGHEIGCHSNEHLWLIKMNYKEVMEDTRKAIDTLEQCTGKKVLSYRAPAFSVSESNPWVFEILTACGIERDASVFPALREFGGFSTFNEKTPSLISYNGVIIKEFPISTIKLLGNEIAYSGGGYFRLFPLSFIRKQIKKNSYSMTYFHIFDLLPETNKVMTREKFEKYFKENGSLLNRYKRFIKSNVGTKRAFNKLVNLIQHEAFVNLVEADSVIDWSAVPKVNLKHH